MKKNLSKILAILALVSCTYLAGCISLCPDSVNQAINMKVQAQQIALQKDIEVTQAEADAKKTEAYAQGDAQANVIRAQADATANKLRAASLTPALVEWTAIAKWDGHRPQVEGSGSGGILIQLPK